MVFHQIKIILKKLCAGSCGPLSKDADGAAVQQLAGHPDLLRQGHTRMLDQLDQLIRRQPAKGFGSVLCRCARPKITPKTTGTSQIIFKNLPGFLQKALAFFCEIRYA